MVDKWDLPVHSLALVLHIIGYLLIKILLYFGELLVTPYDVLSDVLVLIRFDHLLVLLVEIDLVGLVHGRNVCRLHIFVFAR